MSLPKWPVRDEYVTQTEYGPGMTMAQIADYERARAEAAIARLRKLQRAATRFMMGSLAAKYSDYGAIEALAEVLAQIGDIPEQP